MKRIAKWLAAMAVCFALLIAPVNDSQAALTKTTTINLVDAWQALGSATMAVGNSKDISGSYETIVYLEIPYSDDDAQAGVGVIIEISYGDENWIAMPGGSFTTPAVDPATTTINDADVNAAETQLVLTDAETGLFDLPGQKWFIVDGTVGNSESVRSVYYGGTDDVTVCSGFLHDHANGLAVYDYVFETAIAIPTAASYVRVLINNTDADADIHWTSRVSMVTSLN